MNHSIYPCLWFDGQAGSAASFYCGIFENSRIMSDTPMVTTFNLNGRKFMGLNGGPLYKINPSISFFALCDSVRDIDEKWELLSKGGSVLMALDHYPWSEKYGWCQDQFGVNWQLMLGKMEESDSRIVPAMMFTKAQAGRAERAIQFYTSVFKDSSVGEISRYVKGEHDVEGTIKHGRFQLNGQVFVAMDSSMPHAFSFNEGISWVVECDTQEEIDYYWAKLTTGGEEGRCGWLKDQFGVSWQVVPTILGKLMSDPTRSQRVVAAFMQMKKFDIEKLEQA